MANRHLSRSIVLQTLFEWDFNGSKSIDVEKVVNRNIDEFAPGLTDDSFILSLIDKIIQKKVDLDLIIQKAAPEWPIEKISIVDRNILRIGLYELLFADRKEVPAKVAINEAVELSKAYGGENSSKFVNGVLGAVYKEIGEPGKDEIGKKKKTIPDIPYDKMPIEKLGGAVVYAVKDGEIYLALIHDIFGHWTLSKGHYKEGETDEVGTARVVQEEMGLSGVTLKDELGKNEYIAKNPEKGKIRKQVVYHLAEVPYAPVSLGEKQGLDDARWFKLTEILDLNFYDDILPLITKAVGILTK
ncbi:MAG: transcription antitermination factor NusB [Candidatus Paceibacterota bacterium]